MSPSTEKLDARGCRRASAPLATFPPLLPPLTSLPAGSCHCRRGLAWTDQRVPVTDDKVEGIVLDCGVAGGQIAAGVAADVPFCLF